MSRKQNDSTEVSSVDVETHVIRVILLSIVVLTVFKIEPLGLRLERPEEDRIREIAHDEDDVILPPNRGNGYRRDLANHGIECKRSHGAPANAL